MRKPNKNNQGYQSQNAEENLTEEEEIESLDEASDNSYVYVKDSSHKKFGPYSLMLESETVRLQKFSLPFKDFNQKYPEIPRSFWNKQRQEMGITTRAVVGKAIDIPSTDFTLSYKDFHEKHDNITESQYKLQKEKLGLTTRNATRRDFLPSELALPYKDFSPLNPGISEFQWQAARRREGLASKKNVGEASTISPADFARPFDDFHIDYPNITKHQWDRQKLRLKGQRVKFRVAKLYKTDRDFSSQPASREPSPSLGSKRLLDLDEPPNSKRTRRERVDGGGSQSGAAFPGTAMGGGGSWGEQQVNDVRTTVRQHLTTLELPTVRRTRANTDAATLQTQARQIAGAGLLNLAQSQPEILVQLLGDGSFTESERGTLSRVIGSDEDTRKYVLGNASSNLAAALRWPSEGLGVGLGAPNPAPTAPTGLPTNRRVQEWALLDGRFVNALDDLSTAMPQPAEINVGIGELPENVNSRSEYALLVTQPEAQKMIQAALSVADTQNGYYELYHRELSVNPNYIGPVRAELKNPLLSTITDAHKQQFENAATDIENRIQYSHLFEYRGTENADGMSSIAPMQPTAPSAAAPPSSLPASYLAPPSSVAFDSSSIPNGGLEAEEGLLPSDTQRYLESLSPRFWDNALLGPLPSLSANEVPADASLPNPLAPSDTEWWETYLASPPRVSPRGHLAELPDTRDREPFEGAVPSRQGSHDVSARHSPERGAPRSQSKGR